MVFLSIDIASSCWRFITVFIITQILIWKLVLWVKRLILMHDARALLEIRKGFLVLTSVYVKDRSVKVKIFLVENVFFIIICFLVTIILSIVFVTAGVLV